MTDVLYDYCVIVTSMFSVGHRSEYVNDVNRSRHGICGVKPLIPGCGEIFCHIERGWQRKEAGGMHILIGLWPRKMFIIKPPCEILHSHWPA